MTIYNANVIYEAKTSDESWLKEHYQRVLTMSKSLSDFLKVHVEQPMILIM